LESDVFINVPVLKHHGGAGITIGMKNLMGIVWERRWWHDNNLHQCIADFASYRKPDLTVVDAFNVMMKNGPRGISIADVVNMKSLLVGKDIVAIDAAAAKLFGQDPSQVDFINKAYAMGLGNKNLEQLNIKRIKL